MIAPSHILTEEAVSRPSLQNVLLTINQVAELLGFSRWKVYDLINQHGLPYLKVGEHRRIRMDSLHWWLEQQECSTDPLIQTILEERRASSVHTSETPKPQKKKRSIR